ncbi:MAG: menaquinone biosynthesis decarboxylase [Turicibacter sp.]|nr:menaquinone biosynthesis decarboxylase [Turicibacter sp.]
MPYRDLQAFIKKLEEGDRELVRIKVPVSADLEITEICDRVSKKFGPALLFENVENSKFPLLINAMGTYKRMNLALGVGSMDEIAADIRDMIDLRSYLGVKKLFKKIPLAWRLLSAFPIKTRHAACQEVVNFSPDLLELPILKCWPQDGGKFITLPLVMTKDPKTSVQNTGMYRLQVYDGKTTGMHWHWHKDGREIYEQYRELGGKMPVSVAIGCDPAITYSATAPLPKFIDEMMFAGFLRRKNVRMVKSKTNGIYVPADAEFVLEGYVDVKEPLREEGPFGDHTGYYSLSDFYPVFHLTCITHKKNAVYPTTIVGQPPMEDCYIGKATERIFLPLVQMQYPEVSDYYFPLEGVFHNCVIVSLKKRFPGHGPKIMNAFWGLGQMMYTKMIIVVDDGVLPSDINAVLEAIFRHACMEEDLIISKGPLDALDHASESSHYGYRLGIDATQKLGIELENRKVQPNGAKGFQVVGKPLAGIGALKAQFPELVDVRLVCQSESHCLITISFHKKNHAHGHELLKGLWQLPAFKEAKIVILFDGDVDLADLSKSAWKVFNNIDAHRDLQKNNGQDFVRLGIDATKKREAHGHPRAWPDDIAMSEGIKEKVSRRWAEYGID